jgi:hypothetical protein
MNTSISKSFDLGLFGRFQTTISVPTAWIWCQNGLSRNSRLIRACRPTHARTHALRRVVCATSAGDYRAKRGPTRVATPSSNQKLLAARGRAWTCVAREAGVGGPIRNSPFGSTFTKFGDRLNDYFGSEWKFCDLETLNISTFQIWMIA